MTFGVVFSTVLEHWSVSPPLHEGKGWGLLQGPESEVSLARSGLLSDLLAEVLLVWTAIGNLGSRRQQGKALGPVQYSETEFKLSGAHLLPTSGGGRGQGKQ